MKASFSYILNNDKVALQRIHRLYYKQTNINKLEDTNNGDSQTDKFLNRKSFALSGQLGKRMDLPRKITQKQSIRRSSTRKLDKEQSISVLDDSNVGQLHHTLTSLKT
jgi:hypothetical protein